MIQLPEGSWWDWDVVDWNAVQFRLGAGYDLSYHHGLKLVFGDPVFVMCPAVFQDPTFRDPTPDEVQLVSRQVGEAPAVVVAFEADAGGSEPASGLIAAGQLKSSRGSSSGTGAGIWRPGNVWPRGYDRQWRDRSPAYAASALGSPPAAGKAVSSSNSRRFLRQW
ncbi:hypothetical protein ACGFZP_31565 [Kitasatospora sp. NPDC048239]|uniref:hypothetical protein n=1 Tax=Kitasatospora sp. NPDC048239 TaxID=3364046 RepID=UPI0037218523